MAEFLMKMRVVMDTRGRVVQAVPVGREPCPFPKWTTKGHTIELREIYSAVHDHYHRSGRESLQPASI